MSVEETETKVILTVGNSSATILKYGATVLSWVNGGKERLWLSEAAKTDGSKAVRGGIPLVFPVFGKQKNPDHPTYPLPQHGFARTSTWEFLGQTSSSPLTVQFALSPDQVDPESLKLWGEGKYDFTLILSVSLDENSLNTKIEVENTGSIPFEFNWLFHTYYRVPDIEDSLVTNLVDQKCTDQLLKEDYTEKAPVVSFHEEFDRIYKDVPENLTLQIVELGKVVVNVYRTGLPDAVVWNPWVEKSKGMADFEPKDGWKEMLCIEPGYVGKMKNLKPGEKWEGAQLAKLGGEIMVQSDIYK